MALEILISPLLGQTRHGFFGRRGGVSSGIYSGLNCGTGSGDLVDAVARNRSLVAEWFGLAEHCLLTAHQSHSAKAVVLHDIPVERPRADAMATATPGLALGILTADCLPVLLADLTSGVIGAAHAGWRGALAGILEATIDAMETLGATRKQIQAAIGPAISQRAYEVGPEFLSGFLDEDPGYSRFFLEGNDDRMMFDLPSFGLHRLRQAGVGAAHWTGHCTYSNPVCFHSYRRSCHENTNDYGRLISVIRL